MACEDVEPDEFAEGWRIAGRSRTAVAEPTVRRALCPECGTLSVCEDIEPEEFEDRWLVSGRPRIAVADKSARRQFCPACGSSCREVLREPAEGL